MNIYKMKMIWVMVILSSVLVGGFSDTCPSSQFIEIMGTNTIRCDAHAEINQYYWYIGSTSETDPILKLVNGKVGGSKYNDGHYDITPTGDMTIKNAKLEHEATYTFVAFFTNDSVWTRDISVIITNAPTQLCPKIPACAECGKCEVIQPENESANLTCFIEGVRPQPVMYWTYEGVANVTKNESHSELTNHTRDTWTVSTMIVYKMPCGETAVFNCYIYSDGWLLNISLSAKVEVNSERCHDISTEKPSNVPKKGCFKLDLIPCIFIWVIIVAIAIICTVISICLTRSYKQKDPLKDALKKYYLKKFNYGVNSSYAVCDCVFRTSEEDVECATSDDIFKESFFNNSDCVIFTGKVGFGKTYLFQHVARLWAKGEILQNAIVVYIKLKPFCKNACILEEVVKYMDGQFQSVEALSSILQERECLLLLDGLSNLTLENSDVKELVKGNSESETQSKTNSLSADNYMLNNLDNFKKLKVWVTCRQLNTIKFSRRYKKVKLEGFNEDKKKTILQQMVKLNVNEFEETKDIGEESRLLSQDSTLPESIDVITKCPLVFYAFASNYLIPKYQNRLQTKTDSTIMIANLMGRLLHFDNNQIHLSQTKHFQLLWTLFEFCKDEENSKQLRSKFDGKDLMFTIGNNEENMSLVKDLFTRYMGANEITVSTLTFCGGYPPSLDSCKLPNVEKELTFQNVRLEDKQFTGLISRFLTQTLTINFIDSVVPETFSKNQLTSIRQTYEEEIKLNVNRKIDDEAFDLHVEEGKWIKSKQDEATSLVQSTTV